MIETTNPEFTIAQSETMAQSFGQVHLKLTAQTLDDGRVRVCLYRYQLEDGQLDYFPVTHRTLSGRMDDADEVQFDEIMATYEEMVAGHLRKNQRFNQ